MSEGYAICLNEWALDKDIKNELGLLLIISSLCAEKGFCYASNKYLSELFDETEISISRKIKKLVDKNYVSVSYQKRGTQIISRELRLTNLLMDHYQNCYRTVNKNVKENNTSNNNTSNNKKESISKDILKKEFENLWKLYPKKEGKFNSEKTYVKYRNEGVSYETILKGLNNYLEHIKSKGIERQYIKNGSTWFNQKCWEDEYEEVEVKPMIEEVREGVFQF